MPLFIGNSTTPVYGVYVGQIPSDTNIIPLSTPTININTATGVITSTVTQSTAGYVNIGSSSNTLALTTQASKTITPTNATITAVAANRYTTGAITVAAVPTETATFSSNGTYNPTSGKWFSQVTVNVPIGSTIKNQNKTVIPSETTQYISCDVDSNNYTGLGTVTVNSIIATYVGSEITRNSATNVIISGPSISIPAGYYESNVTKTIPNGEFVSGMIIETSPTLSINASGLITASNSEIVSLGPVDEAGYFSGSVRLSLPLNGTTTQQLSTTGARTIIPTTTTQTAVGANVYTTGIVSVAGDSNLTPSNIKNGVTIFGTTGTYGGGTSATFGTLTITANNSYSAASYGYDGFSSVTVNVPSSGITPTGNLSITANGANIDVSQYATVTVDIPIQGVQIVDTTDINGGTIRTITAANISENQNLVALLADTLETLNCDTITSLSAQSIRGKSTLKHVHLNNCTTIGTDVFYASTGILDLVFPNLTTVNDRPCYGCNRMTAVDWGMPNKISNGCFQNCSALSTLVLRKSSVVTLQNINAFTGTPFSSGGSGGTIYVPSSLISSYQTASNWQSIHGYGTITWTAIEGSIYENQYVDGTAIS